MLSATKVRIYPTQAQAEFLITQFGAVRFAYNKALHVKSHLYRKHGVTLDPKTDIKPLVEAIPFNCFTAIGYSSSPGLQ